MEAEQVSDKTGSIEPVKGSDNRRNTSSRSDGRSCYNSRDESETYTLTFDDANCTAGDYVAYMKNDSTDKNHMVVSNVNLNSDADSSFEIVTVTGTPAGGAVTATPSLANQAGTSNTAVATSMTVVESDVSPISGLTDALGFYKRNVKSGTSTDIDTGDILRIGPGQAVAIKVKLGTSVSCFGEIVVYFEPGK